DEEVRRDRTDHRRDECQGTEHGERGHEQCNRGDNLDEACHVAEPLTDADSVEQSHHCGGAQELRTAGEQEHSRERDLNGPERNESTATAADRRYLSE